MPNRTEMTFAQWPASPLQVPRFVQACELEPLGNGVYDPKPFPSRYAEVPDELYLREFMALDIDDEEQIVGFLQQHGFFGRGVQDLASRWDSPQADRLLARIEPLVRPHLSESDTMNARNVFHIDEVRAHVTSLRDAIRGWQVFMAARSVESFVAEAEAEETKEWLVEEERIASPADVHPRFAAIGPYGVAMELLEMWLNGGLGDISAQVRFVPTGDSARFDPAPECDLYGAMCRQLFNDMLRRAQYHVCRNEPCGRLFVHQRGRSKSQHRTTGVQFCSPSCAWAQLQRERRRKGAAKRQEGSHDAGS